MSELNIYQKLSVIQNELVVTKNQRNTFGNYNFRSAEDILEAVKPICKKHDTVLIVSDKVILVGDRNYIEATATLYDLDSNKLIGSSIETTASAREALIQKGMQDAQITGSSSSYARKYALGGLFNLDDNKDPDATNKHDKGTPDAPKTSNNYKNDTDAVAIETQKGLAKIMGSLNKEENKEYRPLIISQICNERKVDKWSDIKFDKTFTYNALLEQVISMLNLAKAGI